MSDTPILFVEVLTVLCYNQINQNLIIWLLTNCLDTTSVKAILYILEVKKHNGNSFKQNNERLEAKTISLTQ